ncbi:MAG: PD-(D/E)XK nuclease family protein [Candidatus Sungbacteria bacterium]|uniref:PD-(D/E)XK nuclease family protein n=1 Tax=Candidatus Sungiibacteriota bacterium TaxID=2750080 RepID=A0A9D6DP45_9BACT|nr:PD-(D/E)XK nuclease family protein [Candidatus Sungbacteria bacterium]
MSQYYNPKRTRNLFNPDAKTPFRLSRSKIDLFLNCPRCFYLDRRLGVAQPPGFPFSLNSAVDKLLKKEFDAHRVQATAHPLMKKYGVDAVPLNHPRLGEWRDALGGGIQYLHQPTNLLVTGGVDDVWVNPQGEFIVVDYKATAKDSEVNLEADWQIGYKRQVEVYQWLFRRNDFKVSDTAYFVYANGNADAEAFDGRLEFNVSVLAYQGDDSWVDKTLFNLYKCLSSESLPSSGPDCDYCAYRQAANICEWRIQSNSTNENS